MASDHSGRRVDFSALHVLTQFIFRRTPPAHLPLSLEHCTRFDPFVVRVWLLVYEYYLLSVLVNITGVYYRSNEKQDFVSLSAFCSW